MRTHPVHSPGYGPDSLTVYETKNFSFFLLKVTVPSETEERPDTIRHIFALVTRANILTSVQDFFVFKQAIKKIEFRLREAKRAMGTRMIRIWPITRFSLAYSAAEHYEVDMAFCDTPSCPPS